MMDCDNFTFEFFRQKLENVENKINRILTRENIIMAQIDDLNAAIAAEDVEISDLLASITKVDADIDKLIAQIKVGGVPTNLTTQLAAIASHTSALTTGAAQLKADDAKANAGGSTPGAPVISSALTATGTVGTPFSYSSTASNSPTGWSATGLLAGLSIDAVSGLITGTPSTAGVSTISLTATNASGSDTESLVLTIS